MMGPDADRGYLTVILSLSLLVLAGAVTYSPGSEAQPGEWIYHTSQEIVSRMEQLADANRHVADYFTAQDLFAIDEMEDERVVPILFLGDMDDDERPWVMLLGAHHGDEPDSAEAVLGFAEHLLDTAGKGDARSIRIIQSTNIAVLPVVNPWGLDNGIRYDERGEDPNRDYPFDPSPKTSTSDGIPLNTAGALTVHNLAFRYPFSMALSYHTGSYGIFTPWGCNGMGNITPDWACFVDMGSALSRASGGELPHGPANDFGLVGYLNGAFDDHLYGSTFASYQLSDPAEALPWSTATCTIELGTGKGESPSLLGSTEGVYDPGGEEDGTVPMGIRMALAACELAAPSLTGGVEVEGDSARVGIRVSGSIDPKEIECMAVLPNGSSCYLDLEVEGLHPFLPEVVYTAGMELPADVSTVSFEVSCRTDPEWGEYASVGFPDIAPQSLLARSRGSGGRFRDLDLVMGYSRDSHPADDTLEILEYDPIEAYAGIGGVCLISIKLKEDEGIQNLTFRAYMGDVYEEVTYNSSTAAGGWREYWFPIPSAEGAGTLEVLLVTDAGEYRDSAVISFKPYAYVHWFDFWCNFTAGKSYRMGCSVEGASGPLPVLYGISRASASSWTGSNWILEPRSIVASGSGTTWFDLEVPLTSGEFYFRMTTDPGGAESRDLMTIYPSGWFSKIPARVDGYDITIGPALILHTVDGIQVADPDTADVLVDVTVSREAGITPLKADMQWVWKDEMSKWELDMLMAEAEEGGVDPTSVRGGWIGYLEADEDDWTYEIEARATIEYDGYTIKAWAGGGFGGEEPQEPAGEFTIPEEEDEGYSFPWGVVLFILFLVVLVFIVALIRYPAHTRDPVPKEPESGRREDGSRGPAPRRTGRPQIPAEKKTGLRLR